MSSNKYTYSDEKDPRRYRKNTSFYPDSSVDPFYRGV